MTLTNSGTGTTTLQTSIEVISANSTLSFYSGNWKLTNPSKDYNFAISMSNGTINFGYLDGTGTPSVSMGLQFKQTGGKTSVNSNTTLQTTDEASIPINFDGGTLTVADDITFTVSTVYFGDGTHTLTVNLFIDQPTSTGSLIKGLDNATAIYFDDSLNTSLRITAEGVGPPALGTVWTVIDDSANPDGISGTPFLFFPPTGYTGVAHGDEYTTLQITTS